MYQTIMTIKGLRYRL